MFCLANGNKDIYDIMLNEAYPAWKMIEFDRENLQNFIKIRKKYLLY